MVGRYAQNNPYLGRTRRSDLGHVSMAQCSLTRTGSDISPILPRPFLYDASPSNLYF